jgi:Ni/Co efflux regulator RcnB
MKTLKTMIAATLAAGTLLGATAADAAYWGPMHRPGDHHVVRYIPGPHRWVRGDRFAPEYGRFVFVDDWRGYRLPRPAFGAHWVRVGGEYLLISNRTGRILDVIVRY